MLAACVDIPTPLNALATKRRHTGAEAFAAAPSTLWHLRFSLAERTGSSWFVVARTGAFVAARATLAEALAADTASKTGPDHVASFAAFPWNPWCVVGCCWPFVKTRVDVQLCLCRCHLVTLQRWQISQPAPQGKHGAAGAAEGFDVDSSGEPLLAISCITSTEMGAEVCSLRFLGGALFAGLADGTIRAFLANGDVKDLTVCICCLIYIH